MKSLLAALAVVGLVALLLLAIYQIARWLSGLRASQQPAHARYDADTTALLDEKRQLLNHLREIRFDFDTGKLGQDDYAILRDRYETRAAEVLELLDAKAQTDNTAPQLAKTPS